MQAAGDLDRAVIEAKDLFELQALAVETPQNMPAAGGPDIHCQISLFFHITWSL